MRSLVYYVATSLDGFIADPSGDFSAFPVDPDTLAELFTIYPETCPAHARDALGVTAGSRRFDTVLMGRRTHEPAEAQGLEGGAYPHLRQIVVSHRPAGDLEVIDGDVAAAVARLKAEPGGDIWLCGGGDLAAQLADQIDEIQLKINPIVLGAGIPLFGRGAQPLSLRLTDSRALPGGVLLATYGR